MDAISQTTFSNAFSWMKMCEYRLKFHWRLFPRVQLTISQHWFRQWLGADRATSHYLDQWWLDYRRIYASLGLNELRCYTAVSRHIHIRLDAWNCQLVQLEYLGWGLKLFLPRKMVDSISLCSPNRLEPVKYFLWNNHMVSLWYLMSLYYQFSFKLCSLITVHCCLISTGAIPQW